MKEDLGKDVVVLWACGVGPKGLVVTKSVRPSGTLWVFKKGGPWATEAHHV